MYLYFERFECYEPWKQSLLFQVDKTWMNSKWWTGYLFLINFSRFKNDRRCVNSIFDLSTWCDCLIKFYSIHLCPGSIISVVIWTNNWTNMFPTRLAYNFIWVFCDRNVYLLMNHSWIIPILRPFIRIWHLVAIYLKFKMKVCVFKDVSSCRITQYFYSVLVPRRCGTCSLRKCYWQSTMSAGLRLCKRFREKVSYVFASSQYHWTHCSFVVRIMVILGKHSFIIRFK